MKVTAFAPATVGNCAVGFDTLGFAVEAIGDEVTLTRRTQPGLSISAIDETISGIKESIPVDPDKNTATVALQTMMDELKMEYGFDVRIKKGIPLSSGLGGSAASAVAAVIAANAFLKSPCDLRQLCRFALAGEKKSSDSAHPDNVAPCLYGGLVLIQPVNPLQIIPVKVPQGIHVVLVHPKILVPTKQARAILRQEVLLSDHVKQSSFLGGFLLGCERSDLALIRKSLMDIVIEPQRSVLIPGFAAAKVAAIKAGALGFSISGSGSSVFAWTDSPDVAQEVRASIEAEFKRSSVETDVWITRISATGARILP